MTNMIGKVTGVDWSKAPEGTTHVKLNKNTRNFLFWYKFNSKGKHIWSAYQWLENTLFGSVADSIYISKEEDLVTMKKEVKSIKDLEVGMFVKTNFNVTLLITCPLRSGEMQSSYDLSNTRGGGAWTQSGYHKFISWSYSLNGEYTPVIHEPLPTAEELKIKELEKSIEDAQRQIAFASKQMEELKELRK